jgi:hypothetical protein
LLFAEDQAPDEVKKILYMITLTSASEMQKSQSKRECKTANIRLNSDEPWDTFQAQLLVKIDQELKPKKSDIALYKIMCTVTRIISKPGICLQSEEDYSVMIEKILKVKGKSPPDVNIAINSINKSSDSDKENDSDNAEEEQGGKKKKGKGASIIFFAVNSMLIQLSRRRNRQSTPQIMRRPRMYESYAKNGLAGSQPLSAVARTASLNRILELTSLLVTSTLTDGLPQW